MSRSLLMQDMWSGVWFAAPVESVVSDGTAGVVVAVECRDSKRAARSAAEELNWSAHNCRVQLRDLMDARKEAA